MAHHDTHTRAGVSGEPEGGRFKGQNILRLSMAMRWSSSCGPQQHVSRTTERVFYKKGRGIAGVATPHRTFRFLPALMAALLGAADSIHTISKQN